MVRDTGPTGDPYPRGMPRDHVAPSAGAIPAIDLPLCRDKRVRHVGVVFVHGIGSQEQGEILRDWGGAMASVLIDFRVAAGADGDPVLATQLDPTAPGRIFVELQLPETTGPDGKAIPEEHWLLTEAWWAHEITPPSFGQMAQWLGPDGAVPRIVKTIIPRSTGRSDPRSMACSPEPGGSPLPAAPQRATGERRSRGLRDRAERAMTGWRADKVGQTRSWLLQVGAWAYLQAFSALLLLIYGVLRSIEALIPVGPLANGALTRPIDRFVLEWFGDVFVLLGVPATAASVRGRLARAIADLAGAQADEIVVIAHSGGAIVSWTTLADENTQDLRVDQLVTIGEGLNLGWNITSGDGTSDDADGMLDRARHRFRLLYRPLLTSRDKLRWVDYWGSRDPAPSGSLDPPDAELEPDAERFVSMPIWNLLSFREDHGGYWENDEEFVIPLLRRLEGPRPGGASFFGSQADHELRSNRRRRRLSVRSVWGQVCLMAPVAAIITSFVAGKDLIPRVGDTIAAVWAVVPGSGIVSGPVDAVRGLHLEGIGPLDTLAEVGVWVVVALIGIAAGYALISPPERGAPWVTATTRPAKIIAFLVDNGPLIVATPLVVLLATALVRFAGGATPTGIAAFADALLWLVIAVAVVAAAFAASEEALGVRIASTIVILALGSLLLLAPIAAIVIFPAVGRMVLGSVAVVIGFAILARLGRWRWTAWDLRERLTSHATNPAYGSIAPVAMQCIVLLLAVAAFFVAVSFEVAAAAWFGLALALFAVLAGIGIDVNGPGPHKSGGPARTSFDTYATQVRR